jgi:hypothetical protein
MQVRGFVFLSPAPVGRFPSTLLGIVREHTASNQRGPESILQNGEI